MMEVSDIEKNLTFTGKYCNMYQLKITLNGIKPPIWRRLLVSENIPLYRLHHIIQICMGWENSHLHFFGRIESKIGDVHLWDDGETTPDELINIRDILVLENPTLAYTYDLGDNWVHTIELEQVHPMMKTQRKCIGGERRCPPEDCVGKIGYLNLLRKLKHPKSNEYLEPIGWLGENFDPEFIDIKMINNQLALLSEYIREYEEGEYLSMGQHESQNCYRERWQSLSHLNDSSKKESLPPGSLQLLDFQLKINPQDFEALHKRARFKADNDDLHGAIVDFMRILELRPCDYISFYNIGTFRMELKEYEEALDFYNKAIPLCPISSIAYERRAYVKCHLNDERGAIEDYTRAIENDDKNYMALCNRGFTKISINDYTGALDDFTLLINPDYAVTSISMS